MKNDAHMHGRIVTPDPDHVKMGKGIEKGRLINALQTAHSSRPGGSGTLMKKSGYLTCSEDTVRGVSGKAQK